MTAIAYLIKRNPEFYASQCTHTCNCQFENCLSWILSYMSASYSSYIPHTHFCWLLFSFPSWPKDYYFTDPLHRNSTSPPKKQHVNLTSYSPQVWTCVAVYPLTTCDGIWTLFTFTCMQLDFFTPSVLFLSPHSAFAVCCASWLVK